MDNLKIYQKVSHFSLLDQKMAFIGDNVEITGSGIINWNFIDIKGYRNIVQGNGYKTPTLGETRLM